MNKIAKPFELFPDPYVAEAFSAPFLPDSGYKFATLVPDADYLSEPAELSHITAALFQEHTGQPMRLSLSGFSGPSFTAAPHIAHSKYDGLVGSMQELAKVFDIQPELFGLEPGDERFGALGKWAIAAARRGNHRLIAAHLIHVTHAGKRAIDALVYPASFQEELQGHLTSAVAKHVSPEDFGPEVSGLAYIYQSLTTMGAGAIRFADMAAASTLPTAAQFRASNRV